MTQQDIKRIEYLKDSYKGNTEEYALSIQYLLSIIDQLRSEGSLMERLLSKGYEIDGGEFVYIINEDMARGRGGFVLNPEREYRAFPNYESLSQHLESIIKEQA